jgi:ankyrin repeat protein
MSLFDACRNGDIEMVKLLIKDENDFKSRKYDNALIWAASNGHFEVVKYLVEKGADIHAKDDQPLQYACVFGHFKIAKYLVEKGAHIHAGNDYGFRRACHHGHFQVSRFLIEKGCNISLIPEKDRNKVIRYITLCDKVEKRAANKIGSWWIPICYDLNRECGKRMMERSWKRVKAMYAERN